MGAWTFQLATLVAGCLTYCCFFSVGVPIMDFYTDLDLLVTLYKAGYWVYATMMLLPIILKYIVVLITSLTMVKNRKYRPVGCFFALLNLYPQFLVACLMFKFLRDISKLIKNNQYVNASMRQDTFGIEIRKIVASFEEKREEYFAKVGCFPPFMQVFVQTFFIAVVFAITTSNKSVDICTFNSKITCSENQPYCIINPTKMEESFSNSSAISPDKIDDIIKLLTNNYNSTNCYSVFTVPNMTMTIAPGFEACLPIKSKPLKEDCTNYNEIERIGEHLSMNNKDFKNVEYCQKNCSFAAISSKYHEELAIDIDQLAYNNSFNIDWIRELQNIKFKNFYLDNIWKFIPSYILSVLATFIGMSKISKLITFKNRVLSWFCHPIWITITLIIKGFFLRWWTTKYYTGINVATTGMIYWLLLNIVPHTLLAGIYIIRRDSTTKIIPILMATFSPLIYRTEGTRFFLDEKDIRMYKWNVFLQIILDFTQMPILFYSILDVSAWTVIGPWIVVSPSTVIGFSIAVIDIFTVIQLSKME